MSGSDGCAPTATPWSSARRTVLRMVAGSPPWKPQAMLAEVMNGITAASSPIFQAPKLSPMSQLRSIVFKNRSVSVFPCDAAQLRLQRVARVLAQLRRHLERALGEVHLAAGSELREA